MAMAMLGDASMAHASVPSGCRRSTPASAMYPTALGICNSHLNNHMPLTCKNVHRYQALTSGLGAETIQTQNNASVRFLRDWLMSSMSAGLDDKSEHCIPFILERLQVHRKKYADDQDAPPFFLGLNGVQGAGKTTLVSVPNGLNANVKTF